MTSPPVILNLGDKDTDGKGPVHGAQWLLAGHNQFRLNFDPGEIDGIYGAQTAAATKRAKWALGYPDASVNTSFGPKLRSYLAGTEALPDWYRRRMLQRAKTHSAYIYPSHFHARLIGFPGQGTHSWTVAPHNWQSDNAWDIAFKHGTPLLAVADGKIGDKIGPISTDPNSRFGGLRCYLECANGNQFYYAHLSKLNVKARQVVRQGDRIGLSGSASGVDHLHLGVLRWQEYRPVIEGV